MVNFRGKGMKGKITKGISENYYVTGLGWLHKCSLYKNVFSSTFV